MTTLAVDIPATFFKNNPGAQTLGTSPGSLIANLLPNILVVAGLIFLFLIIHAGFGIITGAGGDPKTIAKSKQTMTYGIIGFLIIVTAYFILQILSITLTGDANTLTNPNFIP